MLGLDGKPADQFVVERMTAGLRHRGPDDSGLHLDGSIAFGFTRLAILDLSHAAHQPMISEDGNHVIVFNGEIFNYIELREELLALGHKFKSSGDTEVLLNAYRQWGPDCLPRLNGMWAFVIYDRVQGRLFGSRDRFGIKPLYCYRAKDHVLFASEIKAIRASGLYCGEVNWKVASRFLLEGSLSDGNESFYLNIEQIPPGSAFEVDFQGRLKQWQYWSLDHLPICEVKDPAQAFADLFEDAVRLRMRSDVPVGVCLSGGLDSTSIICAAARHRTDEGTASGESLLAFCYMAKEYDESAYIKDTLAMTGAHLRELQTNPVELWSRLGTVLWYQDEPVHTMTALVGYELMRVVAANGIRVILNGQGADETIGGYFSYFLDSWLMMLRQGNMGAAKKGIDSYVATHGGNSRRLLMTVLLRVLAWELYRIGVYRQFARWRARKRARANPWFSEELTRRLPNENALTMNETLDDALRQSISSAPLPLYLRIEDRNSMAHSVEARLPFLDYRLVTLLFHLPAEWKVQGPWNKFVLREAMRGRIPESVRARADKMGFPTAGPKWFAHDLYEPVRDLLSSRAVRERGLYNQKEILNDLARHRRGETDVANRLFHVAEFEILLDLLKRDPLHPPRYS